MYVILWYVDTFFLFILDVIDHIKVPCYDFFNFLVLRFQNISHTTNYSLSFILIFYQ